MTADDLAVRVLRTILRDGPKSASYCYVVAGKWKVSQRSLERAKAALGVVSRRDGAGWVWEMPAGVEPQLVDEIPEPCITDPPPGVAEHVPTGPSSAPPSPLDDRIDVFQAAQQVQPDDPRYDAIKALLDETRTGLARAAAGGPLYLLPQAKLRKLLDGQP